MKLLPYVFSAVTLLNLGACQSEPKDKRMPQAERDVVWQLGAKTLKMFENQHIPKENYYIEKEDKVRSDSAVGSLKLTFYAYGKKIVTFKTGSNIFDGVVEEIHPDKTISHAIFLPNPIQQDTFIKRDSVPSP